MIIPRRTGYSWHQGLLWTFFIKPFLALATKYFTVPSFTALAVLFPDYQNLTYVKQLNVALPFNSFSEWTANFALSLNLQPIRHFL